MSAKGVLFFLSFEGRGALRDACGGDRGALGCPRSRSMAALEGLYASWIFSALYNVGN